MSRNGYYALLAASALLSLPGALARLGVLTIGPGEALALSGMGVASALSLVFLVLLGGFVVRGATLIALLVGAIVLPELLVEYHYVSDGLTTPGSEHLRLTLAAITGSSMALLGLCLPMVALAHLMAKKRRVFVLDRRHTLALVFLFLGALYAFTIFVRGYLWHMDAPLLIALFAAFVWKASRIGQSRPGGVQRSVSDSPPATGTPQLFGAALLCFAAYAIALNAALLSDAMLFNGLRAESGGFALVQRIVPLAAKMPLLVALTFLAWRGRGAFAISVLLFGAVAMWTLVPGLLIMSVFAHAVALGGVDVPELSHAQRLLLVMAVTQVVFAVTLLAGIRIPARHVLLLLCLAVCGWFVLLFWPLETRTQAVSALTLVQAGASAALVLTSRARLGALAGFNAFNRRRASGVLADDPDLSGH